MLAAYLGASCVSPGEKVDAMVSTDASHVDARVVRLIHGDPNPEGPGVVEEDALWPGVGAQTGGQQPLLTGSWIELPLNPNGCLLYTSPSPRDQRGARMPSSA